MGVCTRRLLLASVLRNRAQGRQNVAPVRGYGQKYESRDVRLQGREGFQLRRPARADGQTDGQRERGLPAGGTARHGAGEERDQRSGGINPPGRQRRNGHQAAPLPGQLRRPALLRFHHLFHPRDSPGDPSLRLSSGAAGDTEAARSAPQAGAELPLARLGQILSRDFPQRAMDNAAERFLHGYRRPSAPKTRVAGKRRCSPAPPGGSGKTEASSANPGVKPARQLLRGKGRRR